MTLSLALNLSRVLSDRTPIHMVNLLWDDGEFNNWLDWQGPVPVDSCDYGNPIESHLRIFTAANPSVAGVIYDMLLCVLYFDAVQVRFDYVSKSPGYFPRDSFANSMYELPSWVDPFVSNVFSTLDQLSPYYVRLVNRGNDVRFNVAKDVLKPLVVVLSIIHLKALTDHMFWGFPMPKFAGFVASGRVIRVFGTLPHGIERPNVTY